MPRRLKVKTLELGDLELYLIYQHGDEWEDEWRPIQGNPLTELLTVVSKEIWDHALAGFTKPLVKALGIPPQGALRKLPESSCSQRTHCPFYERKLCNARSKVIRHCFEPDVTDDPVARKLGSDLIRLWSEGVYVVVVNEDGGT